jgi:hypothetical protein
MTIEMGNPGVSGYGYTSSGNVGQTGEPHRAENSQASQAAPGAAANAQPANGGASAEAQGDGLGGEVTKKLGQDEVPGFETSASDCLNRARQIARSLNHTDLSSDHLMLALIMDQSARRALGRIGDVTQLREVAMQRLGKNYTKSSADDGSLRPTSDLSDIAKKARDSAAEREQLVSIFDLINAFSKANDRLTYASDEGSRAGALIEAIEKGLVPRVADSMDKIQAVVGEAMQQSQSVQKMLQDLNSKQTYEAEQRQIAFMEDIRRQVREAVDTQVGAALKQFGEDLIRKLDEVTETDEPEAGAGEGPIEIDERGQQAQPLGAETPKPKMNPWGWLALI